MVARSRRAEVVLQHDSVRVLEGMERARARGALCVWKSWGVDSRVAVIKGDQ